MTFIDNSSCVCGQRVSGVPGGRAAHVLYRFCGLSCPSVGVCVWQALCWLSTAQVQDLTAERVRSGGDLGTSLSAADTTESSFLSVS